MTNAWMSEFVYDGFGRRRITREFTWTGSWSQASETRYVYDGLLVLQERDANNTPLVTYTRGLDLSGGMQSAGGIGGLIARTDEKGSVFYHSDGNGNVTTLVDAQQTIEARYLYDPFGNLLGKWGPLADANHYRFSSKEWHPNSGLYAYGVRYYEPNLQRWINADPIGIAGGFNLHRVVHNDPMNEVDPFGWSEFNRPVVVNISLSLPLPPITMLSLPPGFSLPSGFTAPPPADRSTPGIGLLSPFSRLASWEQPKPSQVEAQLLTGLGGRHLAYTPQGRVQAEFAASLITAALPCPKIIKLRTAAEETQVYRVWGGKSGPWGESWTTVNPNTVPNFRSAAGLPDVNAGRFVSEGVLQSTEGVTARGSLVIKAGQQGDLPELLIKNADQRIKLQRVSGANPEF